MKLKLKPRVSIWIRLPSGVRQVTEYNEQEMYKLLKEY
jgi:hypothetical protein